mmetsp:Transcript_3042/g.4269  ORF Transcript_3042/g.4269 Transcript_3042/m.4269 type:complete len:581 (-) Transcript_3042:161-1903(-)
MEKLSCVFIFLFIYSLLECFDCETTMAPSSRSSNPSRKTYCPTVTYGPSQKPRSTVAPTLYPSKSIPTMLPSLGPSKKSVSPSKSPSVSPSSKFTPTQRPSSSPSRKTVYPTCLPTQKVQPVTASPSKLATLAPSNGQIFDVIVIGAGVSGLTAAKTLQTAGKNLIVLEGRNRIGGRTYSNKTSSFPCDIGANWVHNFDTTKNPILNLATGFGLHLLPFDWSNTPTYNEQGAAVSDAVVNAGDAKINKLIRDAATYANTLDADIPLSTALQHVISSQSLLFNSYEKATLHSTLQDEFGTESDSLSAWWYDATGPWVKKDGIILEGYGALVDNLAKGLPVRLGETVTSIDYSNSFSVVVTTATGKQYQAAKVLVTVPLGVLKKGSLAFHPVLPAVKTAAMNRLGMSLLNHVFLQFPTGSLASLSPSLATIDEFNKIPSTISSNAFGYVEMIPLLHLRQQDVIFIEVSASFAETMESKSDTVIVSEVMKEIHFIYPNLAAPNHFKITRWRQDPFAFGSYSYANVGAQGYNGPTTITTYDILAASIGNNRVFFAGEHTSGAYPATVQGAYESGLREAQKILRN